jgi:hypothetical protein
MQPSTSTQLVLPDDLERRLRTLAAGQKVGLPEFIVEILVREVDRHDRLKRWSDSTIVHPTTQSLSATFDALDARLKPQKQ